MITIGRSIQIGRLGLLCAMIAFVLISLWSVSLVYAQDRGDKDGDGVADADDRCPDEPGPRDNGGCPVRDPDSDGDGLSDSADRCPREAGPADNGGCPRPAEPPPGPPPAADNDGDGLTDDVDRCPREAGLADNGGCPRPAEPPSAPPPAADSDGDGLTDDVDRCPREPGYREPGGCPEGRSEGSEETRDESALPAPEVAGPPPAVIPPLGESNGPCVAATSGSFNVNIRGAADANAPIQGSLDPGSVAVVQSVVVRGYEIWITVAGGFILRSFAALLGGSSLSKFTLPFCPSGAEFEHLFFESALPHSVERRQER